MFEYKISIIMPVYNGEEDLETSVNSIINQTMSLSDIEVIFVNDKSTDNSESILKDYCSKYSSFKLINLEENVGAAYGPRNIGLENAKGEFIMFLDSDDEYLSDACESLYETIKKDESIDFVFARYLRVYKEENKIFKGHSPYKDNLHEYSDDLISGFGFSKPIKFLWRNLLSKFIYPETNLNQQILVIEDIKKYPEILTILPSIWTKIYRAKFLKENNFKFPAYISGEDLNFLLETYFKSNKFVFLNSKLIHKYYMRSGSVTKNITYPMVYDSLDSYYNASEILKKNKFKKPSILINPFLLNWINLYFKSKLSKNEKKELYNLIKKLNKNLDKNLTTRALVFLIKFLLKI